MPLCYYITPLLFAATGSAASVAAGRLSFTYGAQVGICIFLLLHLAMFKGLLSGLLWLQVTIMALEGVFRSLEGLVMALRLGMEQGGNQAL